MKRFLSLLMFLAFVPGLMLMAQSKSISGVVTEAANGLTMPGVTVMVKGTTNGTVTNIDGQFSLQVDEADETLVFSFVGMATQEIPMVGKTVFNVAMADDAVAVEEVVVTAYGSKGKVGLKGAITTVSAKELEQVPVATFDQMLQGKTTGLAISSGSGQPGASAKVRIRGTSSITGGSAPLYIMDGTPISAGDFANLNANDFENVVVLKDAAATSIYGSRASNGVILITTKRGQAGDTRINYRYQAGVSVKTQDNFELMNSSEKLWFEEYAKKGVGWDLSPLNPVNAGLSSALLGQHETELNRLRGINTNWQDAFVRNGQTQSHEINLSGGNEKTKFYMAYQNYTQEGLAQRSDLMRHTGRLNLDHEVSKKIRVGVSTTFSYASNSTIESEGGIALANPFAAMYLANTYEELYKPDGSYNRGFYKFPSNDERNFANENDYQSFALTGPNAYDRILNMSSTGENTKFVGVFNAEWDILPGLTAKTQYGIDYRQGQGERYVSPDAFESENASDEASNREGYISESTSRRIETTFTNTLDYKKLIADKHILGVLVGSEYTDRYNQSFGFTGYGLNSKLPESMASITPGTSTNNFIPGVGGGESQRRLFSLFAILNYTLNDKYSFSGSIRRDGSSAFGENNQFAMLYSGGFIWDISREGFMEGVHWVNNLKLRASYGTTGNQGVGDFESLTVWGTPSYNGTPGIGLAGSGDPDIKWEIGHKANLGIDYNLFNNRLNGSVDVYNNITSDLFLVQSLSSTAGVPGDAKRVNAGEMRNRGVELLVNYDIIRNRNFTWSVNGNISYNDNEILDLGQVDEFESGTSIVREGLPLNSHYIPEWAGVNPATGDPMYYAEDGSVTSDFNKAAWVAKFGTSEAPINGGFGSALKYKGFDLSASFTYAYGYSRLNNESFFQENHNFAQYNMSRKMLDIWQKPGDITEIQRLGTERQITSKDIEDSSFLRLRNVQLAYRVPTELLKHSGFIQSIRVYGQAQNLLTWTSWSGFDPEDSNNIATYEYPAARTYSIGVDVAF
ncbi:TonB-dependent receptor [Carboxylicivirga sp. M1479]|uniref:SusC/RagA family TonB-linked outer membrane protein n=1 Tax=Carboxylicivirga sp. M1479 TaxID=2594476 RepID=UPI001177E9D7|nr:TonB-dependent receptor [Carboxylicivirga sp. M1479]TRX63325.1 TonB-dependent receptor [Carboxylicivirga sp. M1479]